MQHFSLYQTLLDKHRFGIDIVNNTHTFNLTDNMVKLLHIVIFALVILSACNNERSHDQLSSISTLLKENKIDSAYTILKDINPNMLNKKENVFYNLLYTEVLYRSFRPITSDSLINTCIDYYNQHSTDKDKLCEAYFYKGMVLFSLNHTEQAIVNLKEAEKLAKDISDEDLKHKVYNGLVTVNYTTANYELAMKYARQELTSAQKANNKLWIAHAYNHLSCVYDKSGRRDSSFYYIKKVIPFISQIPKDAQVYHLSNIGLYYLNNGDTLRAKKYLQKAYKVSPLPDPSNLLARIYYLEDNTKEAFLLWNKTLKQCDLESSIQLKETMLDLLYHSGKYKEAGKIATEIKMLKDSLVHQQQTVKIQELQLDYDHQQAINNTRTTITRLLITFGIITILICIGFFIYRRNIKKEDYSRQLLINKYNERIAELEASGRTLSKEMNDLKQQLNDAEEQKTDVLVCGHALYESILNGATTVSWTKNDFECFLEYYKVMNKGLFIELEHDYTNLSMVNKFLLVLQDMKLDNEQIKHILGFSTGALRSARFRIRSKKKE